MKKLAPLAIFFLLIPVTASAAKPEKVSLPVPFLWEIPDGVWVPPWSGACEEASIMAVEGYYLKKQKKILGKTEAKNAMLPLFAIENKIFGYNTDTNAAETSQLINDYTSYDSYVVEDPTLEQMKDELRSGRPIITMHYGYDLNNPRHRFRRGGSSYHVMSIAGFDEEKSEFLVNDSEMNDGIDFRYKYATIMDTLHDFDKKTKRAEGPARVLFTRPKMIVKASGSNRIFLVRDNKKYYIASPSVFKNHRWSWSLVKTIEKTVLDNYETGPQITK
jgi:hypothetical protein